jgi:hypothetical protein
MPAHSVQRVWSVATNSRIDASGGPSTAAGNSGEDSPRDIVYDDVLGRSRALSPTLLKWGIVTVVTVIAAVLALAYLTPAQGGAGNCGSPHAQKAEPLTQHRHLSEGTKEKKPLTL